MVISLLAFLFIINVTQCIYTLLPSPQSPRSTLLSMLISIDARPTHLVLGLQVSVKTIVSFTFVPLFFLLFFSCRKCICNDAPTLINSITFFKLSSVISNLLLSYDSARFEQKLFSFNIFKSTIAY